MLFRDVVHASGGSSSTTQSIASTGSSVVYMSTTSSGISNDLLDLLVVRKNGEIQAFHGNDLSLQWTSPANAITKNDLEHNSSFTIQHCQKIDAYSASLGLFLGRDDVLATFPEPVTQEYNPDLLALVISRHGLSKLHILSLPTSSGLAGVQKSVQSIYSISLESDASAEYELHAGTATLYANSNNTMSIYDLSNGTAKLQTFKKFNHLSSYVRLSSSMMAAAVDGKVELYNPRFGAIQASSRIVTSGVKRKSDDISSGTCRLVSYNKSQNTIYAIMDAELLAFVIDMRQDGANPRPLGLLIDSISRGESRIDAKDHKSMQELDQCIAENDLQEFERLMAEHLGIRRKLKSLKKWQAKHEKHSGLQKQLEELSRPLPPWLLDADAIRRTSKSRAWIKFALQKVLIWEDGKLSFGFYPPNVVDWLFMLGAFTKSNIESALRQDLLASSTYEIPAGQMVAAIIEVDPSMTNLSAYLSLSKLEASEIACAIRALMESLELFGIEAPQNRLAIMDDVATTNGDNTIEEQEEAANELEEAADEDIALAEFYLGDGADVRNQALKTAIVRLHATPKGAAMQALKAIFTAPEIIAFIYLLRFELAKGSWTSKYLDVNEFMDETDPQDSNIVLVSNLLNVCIDAIGSGGWLDGTAMLASGDQFESEELIASLSVEVGAALTGIEESAYLKNLLGDVIRYGETMQRTKVRKFDSKSSNFDLNKKSGRPLLLPQSGPATAVLPFGMKAEQVISREKIGAGGEVSKRSARDIGRLKSQRVGKYSRERIIV